MHEVDLTVGGSLDQKGWIQYVGKFEDVIDVYTLKNESHSHE